MFDDLLESTVEKKKTNKSWTVMISAIVQTTILGVLILIPLIYTEALPKAMLSTLLIAPPPPPPPPPPPTPVKTIVKPVARLIQSGKLMQPRAIPKEVAVFKEAELPPDVINNFGPRRRIRRHSWREHYRRAPALPPPPRLATPARIKQGGNVTAASIHHADAAVCILRWRARRAFKGTSCFTRSSIRKARLRSSRLFRATRCWCRRHWTP